MYSQSRIIRLSLATTLGVVVASLCLLSLSAQPSGAAHADTPPRQAADLAPVVIHPQGFGETKPLRDLPPAPQTLPAQAT
ncbi:MAG TPA: hypothetical protein VFF70_04885, partial [Anaerolineae bacterium]|nr:hypothetical protein [Anaerolineae bacterium]